MHHFNGIKNLIVSNLSNSINFPEKLFREPGATLIKG